MTLKNKCMYATTEDKLSARQSDPAEAGMTLIETTIALVIIMIALLGVVHSFTYAVTYNAGNAVRTESLDACLEVDVEWA
jgi:Tfp pilus assembly protein PilV